VGSLVGSLVGSSVVGKVTGARVGFSDDILVGVSVGDTLGRSVGAELGAGVGSPESIEVMIISLYGWSRFNFCTKESSLPSPKTEIKILIKSRILCGPFRYRSIDAMAWRQGVSRLTTTHDVSARRTETNPFATTNAPAPSLRLSFVEPLILRLLDVSSEQPAISGIKSCCIFSCSSSATNSLFISLFISESKTLSRKT
jgi:hypothetical protein